MGKYAIGVDYGTLSVRSLLVDIETGKEETFSIYEYPHGVMEQRIPAGTTLPVGWALQEPQDYVDGLSSTIRNVMAEKNILPEEITLAKSKKKYGSQIPKTQKFIMFCIRNIRNCINILDAVPMM